jgi:hypothetical protein
MLISDLQTERLLSSGETEKLATNKKRSVEEMSKDFKRLSDAELFQLCGGLTGHK